MDALLSTHKPSAAKATAADPLGGGNWEAEESEEEAAEPVWAKSTHEEASCDVLAFVAGEEEMGTIKHDKHERNDWQAILRVQQLLSRRRGRFLGVPPQPTNKRKAAPSKPGDGRSPAPGATSIKGNQGQGWLQFCSS